MKNLIRALIVCIGFVSAAVSARAQTYAVQAISGLPATIATGATSNVLATIDVRKSENVGLQFAFANGGVGTGNITLTLKYSLDGITFASAPTTTWVLAATADSTTYTYVTNFSTLGYGYMQIASIASASGSTLTTDSLKYSLKLLTKE